MSTSFTKLILATFVSISIALSPLTVMAADPAPAGVPVADSATTPDVQSEKAAKKTAKKSKKDKKAEKKAKKKSQKKAKAAQEPAAPQQ
ncbi:protein tyrosine phosphatase [Polynucleobacter sp. JS-Mosq-20-D10]|uniref:protein tyrosine phosphatase n=1 Tax=Polynucleobacter sp. JS-Mosq-20-D10 TaxID=2576922 RepID=UPI001BFDAE93|nr:protein tyrosine phosphatase [Polynucleobacter sp. JS-Mosq-20-D10]QWE01537.1 protein tyrosine phosphatase [Polynucleobacter sp. JS-Mosq-20-D10]